MTELIIPQFLAALAVSTHKTIPEEAYLSLGSNLMNSKLLMCMTQMTITVLHFSQKLLRNFYSETEAIKRAI